jgi:hypothetical protein
VAFYFLRGGASRGFAGTRSMADIFANLTQGGVLLMCSVPAGGFASALRVGGG